jgi:hypothetical protein
MTDHEIQLLMAGSPGTGKTSFLALLWLAILNDRTPGLSLPNFNDDRVYLNLIAGRLEGCDPALHTESSEDRDLTLSLLIGDDATPAVLRIPDLSGETWRDATEDRQWPVRVEEQVGRSSGLLLFMHARAFDAGATIGQVNEFADILGADAVATGVASLVEGDAPPATPASGTSAVAESRKPGHKPPTQVALVDALQLICEQRGPEHARVSIVVSAWDLAAAQGTPREFVRKNLPLLDQYLTSNDWWLEVQIFGLSAQGGDFADEAARAKLAQKDPVDRALVQDADGGEISVQDIVLWALREA